jgi:hypothetical protein
MRRLIRRHDMADYDDLREKDELIGDQEYDTESFGEQIQSGDESTEPVRDESHEEATENHEGPLDNLGDKAHGVTEDVKDKFDIN